MGRTTTITGLHSQQKRHHGGHSHGPGGHHHDNTYLLSSNKKDAGVRITRLGLYVNLGMAVSKGLGGWFFNSQALLADGLHSITDLLSDFMTLATISIALRPPTPTYPNGFGKVESLGSLVVSGLLLVGGLLMLQQSAGSLWTILAHGVEHLAHGAEHVHEHSHGLLGHSHAAKDVIPNLNAAWIAGGSIIVKEWLYRATMKIAEEKKSSLLAASAYHHRTDSLTGAAALIAIGGAHILENGAWLDPVAGGLVSLMVIQAGWVNSKSAVLELSDASMDASMTESITKATKKAISAQSDASVRSVLGTKAGQNYLVDIEIAAPSSWTLERMNEVEEAIKETVGRTVRGVRKIRIRFSPEKSTSDPLLVGFVDGAISQKSDSESDAEHHHHDHDHDHSHGPNGNSNAHSHHTSNDGAKATTSELRKR